MRIAIAVAVLLSLARLSNPVSTGDLPGEHTLYRPVGIWMLLGHTAPPDVVVDALWILALAGTVAMLLGLATRASTAVSFVAAVAIAALSFASGHRWSHQYNVVFIAQLAFLGARGGDVLSIDWLIRKLRGLPPIDRARAYQWSLRLVQFAVAAMFASAAFHKLLHGHFTLRWALSDNLRHQLLVRFDLAGLPRPPLVDWLIDEPWRYRTAAVLNLVSQATPILACLLVRRPVLRAICGVFFVIETIALGYVVDLWNLHWLPLFAVFVDWDALIASVTRTRPSHEAAAPPTWTPPRAAQLFVIAFVVYDTVASVIPGLDQRLNTYPFSGFPMFATVLARAPYGDHQAYAVVGGRFDVTSDPPLDLAAQRWFDHSNRNMHESRDPAQLHARLVAMLAQAQRRFPTYTFHRIRLYLTLFEAPAYPAPAHFEPHPIAILGELDSDGTFRTMLGELDGDHLALHPQQVDASSLTFTYVRDNIPTPIHLEATRMNDTVVLQPRLEGDPIFVVATTPDNTAWLVASHDDWKWQ